MEHLEKRSPGAPLEGAAGAGDEAGGFGWHDTADFEALQLARQAARVARRAHVSEPVARVIARACYGGAA